MQYLTLQGTLPTLLLGCLLATSAHAIESPVTGPFFENDALRIHLTPRTPDQMAAFYEARGFPPGALERIRNTCFVTVSIKNKSNQVVWLELGEWRFTSAGKPLRHLDDEYWKAQWDEIGLRQASRSTFGWTQLPLVRDLQPDEQVGGNVVIPGGTRKFTVEASFRTGADKSGEMIRLGFGNVDCPQEPPTQ